MANLNALFGKAQQVADATSKPATTPAPVAGFKLGAGRNAPPNPSTPSANASQPTAAAESNADTQAAESVTPHAEALPPAFPDHTPATLPQRDVPADVSESVQRFVESLNHLHTLTPEPELATSAIRGIMIELKSNPQYIKHVSPDDVRVIVQMMRETMGLAKITKEQKASKRRSSNVKVAEALAELDDMFGDL